MYPGQFRISRIQLINWGTFHGYFSIPVARKGFLTTVEAEDSNERAHRLYLFMGFEPVGESEGHVVLVKRF